MLYILIAPQQLTACPLFFVVLVTIMETDILSNHLNHERLPKSNPKVCGAL